MFKKKTVFVVGAGASAELDLPPGSILANELQQAAWLIRDGILLSRSIDDFLDLHRNNSHVKFYGKAAIVQCILEAERGSNLYYDRNQDIEFKPAKLSDTWLLKFMQMLTPGIPKENARQIFDNVAFIVFNYDRCVEMFLLNALRTVYGMHEEETRSIVHDLNIIHPYGVIDGSVPFGATRANWAQLANGIKTYTEQIGAADVMTNIRAAIDGAEHIVFLGFAYHDQNMTLLKPSKNFDNYKSIYGTAFGMSDSDVRVTIAQINSWFEPKARPQPQGMINIENRLKSAELFDYYAKSLTGGG
jgi:hypothetical protein